MRLLYMIAYALFLCFSFQLCYGEVVPVLMWNPNSPVKDTPAVSALQHISYPTFQGKYLNLFKPENILLFVQDALSIEDLSAHPKELQNIEAWMEKSHSIYLPSVENPTRLIHDLPSHGYNVISLEPGSALSELKLKDNANNLVVVRLPSTVTNPSHSRALQKSDEIIKNVISKVGLLRDFTVIYTGLKPSVDEKVFTHYRVLRSVDGKKSSEAGNLHNGSCILVYIRNSITIRTAGGEVTEIPEANQVSEDAVKKCGNASQMITLSYADITVGQQEFSKLKISLYFLKKGRDWQEDTAKLETMTASGNIHDVYDMELTNTEVKGVPIGNSFACTPQLIYKVLNSTPEGRPLNWTLNFNGVQVEAFMKDSGRFHDAWDCVGFFSIPIWCGLIAAFVTLVILGWGLYMLSDIKTMDRFDDPKGKSIMVPTTVD